MTGSKSQPGAEQLELGSLFAALADTHRRSIVRTLLREPPNARVKCSNFGDGMARSTMTHHFKVLREAGLISQFDYGNRAEIMLRRNDLDTRFPGLLHVVAQEDRQPQKALGATPAGY